VRTLQDIACITDGGDAAAVFSKIDFDWSTAAPDEREQMLRERLAAERAYADSE